MINQVVRFFVHRFLGRFINERLSNDHISIALFGGKLTIENVTLSVQAINELLDAPGLPFEFVYGKIGSLAIDLDWSLLYRPSRMAQDSAGICFEASDVELCVRPVKRARKVNESVIETMWSSVSSQQLAEDYMRQEDEATIKPDEGKILGVASLAEFIQNVCHKVKATATNITIKIEYPRQCRLDGVALLIHLNGLSYEDVTTIDVENETQESSKQIESEGTQPDLQAYAKYSVNLSGVSIFTQEKCVSKDNNDVKYENIPILQFMDQQSLQIHIKESEETAGPKFKFNIDLGAICSIISPRPLQSIIHFFEAISEDEPYDRENQYTREMNYAENYESPQQYSGRFSGNLSQGNFNMWSIPPAKVIQPSTTHIYDQRENYCESVVSSLNSSIITSASKYQRKTINIDCSTEISKFVIKISSLVGVILHDNVLPKSSAKELVQVYQNFFDSAANTSVESELSSENLYCNKNHILLRLHPIVAEGEQNRNKNILKMTTTISAKRIELCEVLEQQITHLIKFNRNKNLPNDQISPEFTMNIETTNSIQREKNSSTKIKIKLEKHVSECDITIIDRLSSFAQQSYRNSPASTNTSGKKDCWGRNTEISINCDLSDIKLRFPVVDLKPLDDPDRIPWWKQNIRTDYLLLRFSDLKMLFYENRLIVNASQIQIFYVESDDLQNHLLTATYHKLTPLKLPEILVDFNERNYTPLASGCQPKLPFSSKRHCRQSSTNDTLTEIILLPGDKSEIDEFCKSTMTNSEIQVKLNIPMVDFFLESKQLYELIYNRLNSDLFMWQPSSPHFTKSKAKKTKPQMGQSLLNTSLMDSIYVSAIAHDDPYEYQTQRPMEQNVSCKSLMDSVYISPKNPSSSQAPIDLSQSDVDDDDDDDDDEKARTSRQLPPKTFSSKIFPHNCSVEIKLGNVSGSCFVPVRDNSKKILPQVYGKFFVKVEQAKIFLVDGFKSDMNLSYLCTQIKNVEMYHCGIVPMNTPLKFDHEAPVEDFMYSTLYKIPEGLTKGIELKGKKNGCAEDMFSLVIEMEKNPAKKVKRVKITAGVHYATLRYNPTSPSLNWVNQLIDFLDVEDYPVEGFNPYRVLSEMQLHLWDSAIDFRPENFCYRTVLEIFYFSINSNIVPSMTGCNLRFILEEFVLSIAPYEESTRKRYPNSVVSCINSKNLIPVLDVGLLDISLRLNDEGLDDDMKKCPIFDLRCFIHDVHFHTCYDSARAFAELIVYVATISNPNNDEQYSMEQSFESSFNSESNLFLTETARQLTREIEEKHQQRVSSLIAEALQESLAEKSTLQTLDKEPTQKQEELKLFLFPDENNKHQLEKETNSAAEITSMTKSLANVDIGEHLSIIKAELGEVIKYEQEYTISNDLSDGLSSDEDYCIIGKPKAAQPQFAGDEFKISDDPLHVVDNHFSVPSSSTMDPLKAPKNFPIPEQRYTLCEMTFTWHLYGGCDFISTPTTTKPTASSGVSSQKAGMSDYYIGGVDSPDASRRAQPINKPKEKITWKSIGGPNRNHEVLVEIQFSKVRFAFEMYPRHSNYASRQVLLVKEFEVRDRLQSSEFNKFLYNPNAKAFSNHRFEDMVAVNAINVRTDPQVNNGEECLLNIKLPNLRLHIDQDTLEFLTDFFNKGKSYDHKADEDKHNKFQPPKPEIPIMSINEDAHLIVDENISLIFDKEESSDSKSLNSDDMIVLRETDSKPVFFREVVFTSDVAICFDYQCKHVELSKGPIAGLLMGLVNLNCSEIVLKKLYNKRGILGVDKLVAYLLNEWRTDIKRNQFPKIIKGVGPLKGVTEIVKAFAELVVVFMNHYQKDGIVRSLQLGAQSFSIRTIAAALEIVTRLICTVQSTVETCFDWVATGPSVRQAKRRNRRRKKRYNRPMDVREGVLNAYHIVKNGINDTANDLIETAATEHDQKGLTGAVGAVIRQVPQIVVCPAVLATQATTNILGGVTSSLVPEARQEAIEKWKMHES